MLLKIRKWIEDNKMFDIGENVVAGVSGGADSVALLMALLDLREEYRLTISVVHANHGLRGVDADRDAEYVKQLCKRFGVPFFLYEASIHELSDKWQMSEETAGRKYRYQCFAEVAKKAGASCIATAHHMGDQAETLLFRMARGTGLTGAVGIRPVSIWDEGEEKIRIVRPLLCCEKNELEAYLKNIGVEWCEDVTNKDCSYARNKIRNRVIPELEEINSRAVSHIAGFASDIVEYESFFDDMVSSYMKKAVRYNDGYEIDRRELLKQPPLLARHVIYRMITMAAESRRDITEEHVKSVYELLEGQSGKRIILPYNVEAVFSYDLLIIKKNKSDFSDDFFDCLISLEDIRNNDDKLRLSLPDGGILLAEIYENAQGENIGKFIKNNYTKVFECDTIKDTLHIRNPLQEDYFVINDNGNKKRIARYFIDNKIPADKRAGQLLVTLGNEVLWHIGGRIGERYKVCDDTKHILRLSYEGGHDERSN